jgi:peptidoglycan/xylan/chitin deacetylase (PgdA/CDA1 family)
MSALNVLASAIGDVTPLQAYRRIIPRELVGFVYHLVCERAGPHIRHLYSSKTPEMFEQDLLYLRENFALPGYDELFGNVRSTPGNRAAFVTFDDGLAECSSTVGPMLAKHRVPCIFFLITDCIDNRHMMYRHKVSLCIGRILELPLSALISRKASWASIFGSAAETKQDLVQGALSFKEKDSAKIDRLCEALEVDWRAYLETSKPYMTQGQIRQLLRAGFKIGAHTRKHAFLADLTAEEMESEIVESCNEIREITGNDNVPFAFPFSGAGVGRDFLQCLRQKHPVLGPAFDTAGVAMDTPFVFNRITADVPLRNGASGTNIPNLLHGAYRSTFLTSLTRMWLGAPQI